MEATNLASSVNFKQNVLTWQRFIGWLYVPNDYLGLTRSLTGLAALLILPLVWIWSHGGPGPAVIPAWRVGAHLLVLPMPSNQINVAMFCLAAVAGLAMIVGFKQRFWPAICAIVIGYYGSVDWVGSGLHFILLEWIMLVAFLFERPGLSPTRRLIQVSTVACYFLSALQKLLFPDFVAGYSLEAILGDMSTLGWGWKGVLPVQNFGHYFWLLLSWVTIAGEFFFAFGLFFPRTRKFAVAAAAFFHLGIAVFLGQFIAIFSLVMWAGLSTFLDKSGASVCAAVKARLHSILMAVVKLLHLKSFAKGSGESAADLAPVPVNGWTKLQSTSAAALMLVLVLFPLRVYFYAGRPADKLSFFDRSPWSYCMYLARQESTRLTASYRDSGGNWHAHVIDKSKDRWGRISSDNETYALAAYLFLVHPEAERVRIENDILLNGHLPQEKILERDRGDSDSEIQVHFSPPLTQIKRAAGPGAADF